MNNSYAIIGSGALGGLYGGMLARAGAEVHFLLHSDYQHVCNHGLRVESPWGDFHLDSVSAYQSAEDLPACDVTIVGLKTTVNDRLPELLSSCTRDGGLVLVLQNGMNVEADSARVVGDQRVLGGCCFLCSNKVGPGHIRHLDYGQIVFGEYLTGSSGITDRVQAIHDDLVAAGIDAKPTEDLLLARWRKLMWNIPFNGLSVVLNASTKELIEDPDSLKLCQQIVREVHAAADKCGVKIPSEMITKTIENTRTMVPYDSSMRVDYLLRRPMEVGAIFGNTLQAAKQGGAEMPAVEILYRELKFIDQKNQSEAASTNDE